MSVVGLLLFIGAFVLAGIWCRSEARTILETERLKRGLR